MKHSCWVQIKLLVFSHPQSLTTTASCKKCVFLPCLARILPRQRNRVRRWRRGDLRIILWWLGRKVSAKSSTGDSDLSENDVVEARKSSSSYWDVSEEDVSVTTKSSAGDSDGSEGDVFVDEESLVLYGQWGGAHRDELKFIQRWFRCILRSPLTVRGTIIFFRAKLTSAVSRAYDIIQRRYRYIRRWCQSEICVTVSLATRRNSLS